MALRVGPGPVFAYECLTVPRRWQVFAGRSLFVGLLLLGLWVVWAPNERVFTNFAELAAINEQFFRILVLTQLAVVMLAAPAVTAGSICVDKSRGTLHHVFVTDLSNREIVLGKLFARLLSVLMLLTCSVPVMALSGLLGGVEIVAVLNAFVVTSGVAVIACTLALTFSVWVRKPHQALLPTYLLLVLWCLIYPTYAIVILGRFARPGTSDALWYLASMNPFALVLAPLDDPTISGWDVTLSFLLIVIVLSALLLTLAIGRVRRVALDQEGRKAKPRKVDVPLRFIDLIPGPLLDGNPILWREWHRKKPTKWTGRFWSIYATVSFLASGLALIAYYSNPGGIGPADFAGAVNGCGVAVGLFLLTISATTSLAEERDRGSLDVILTTPLSTAQILRGKWLGTFAMVPRLAIMPVWVSAGMTLVSGNWLAPLAVLGLILAYSAFITTMGLALATWIPRLGRAIATGIFLYLLLCGGIWFVHDALSRRPDDLHWLLMGNPLQGIFETTEGSGRLSNSGWSRWQLYYGRREVSYEAVLAWMAVLAGVSLWLMLLTISSFDRILGRMTTDVRLNRPPTRDPRATNSFAVKPPPSPLLP